MAVSYKLLFAIFHCWKLSIALLAQPNEEYEQCYMDQEVDEPPCWVGQYLLDCIHPTNQPFAHGSYSKIYRVRIYNQQTNTHGPDIYALKMGSYIINYYNQHTLSETAVAELMYSEMRKDYRVMHSTINITNDTEILYPSIRVYASHDQIRPTIPQVTNGEIRRFYSILMDYHPRIYRTFSDTAMLRPIIWRKMQQQKDGIVFKFLYDASFVLRKLWAHSMIDRDVTLDNFVMSRYGDTWDWKEMTFIKIDYGAVISKQMAQIELSKGDVWRQNGFCWWGSHVNVIFIII